MFIEHDEIPLTNGHRLLTFRGAVLIELLLVYAAFRLPLPWLENLNQRRELGAVSGLRR